MKYKNHPSITALKEKSKISKFIFHEVGNEKSINEIKRLNKNKPLQKFDIPITIIDKNTSVLEDFLAEKSSKLADITALQKKGRKVNKENYSPVSILPTMQILKRVHYATLPFEFIRKKKNSVGKGYILTDFSKAFYCFHSIINYLLHNSTYMDLL